MQGLDVFRVLVHDSFATATLVFCSYRCSVFAEVLHRWNHVSPSKPRTWFGPGYLLLFGSGHGPCISITTSPTTSSLLVSIHPGLHHHLTLPAILGPGHWHLLPFYFFKKKLPRGWLGRAAHVASITSALSSCSTHACKRDEDRRHTDQAAARSRRTRSDGAWDLRRRRRNELTHETNDGAKSEPNAPKLMERGSWLCVAGGAQVRRSLPREAGECAGQLELPAQRSGAYEERRICGTRGRRVRQRKQSAVDVRARYVEDVSHVSNTIAELNLNAHW